MSKIPHFNLSCSENPYIAKLISYTQDSDGSPTQILPYKKKGGMCVGSDNNTP